MAWREAHSLRDLRLQLNAAFPKRSIISDGGIGDAAHQATDSDHNARKKGKDGMRVFTARDFTHDPKTGIDCNWLADTLVLNKDPRVKYIIWNKRICRAYPAHGLKAWQWGPYSGKNAHSKHLHISVSDTLFDSSGKWRLDFPTPLQLINKPDVARITPEEDDSGLYAIPETDEPGVTCPSCGLEYDADLQGFDSDSCPDCRAKEIPPADPPVIPDGQKPVKPPTGTTVEEEGGDFRVGVQPTQLKGWYAAIAGFISSTLGALGTWYAGLPPIVQASIFLGGGLTTSALIIGVIWLKNQRESRAAAKELALIKAKGGGDV